MTQVSMLLTSIGVVVQRYIDGYNHSRSPEVTSQPGVFILSFTDQSKLKKTLLFHITKKI